MTIKSATDQEIRDFFIKRFNKQPEHDKEYYDEWRGRFRGGYAWDAMDLKSRKVWTDLHKKSQKTSTIITKKRDGKIYVYKERDFLIKPDRVWTEDLKNPLKSHGSTKYRKYALSHKSNSRSSKRGSRSGRFKEVY
jgi:hypothetical protein